MIVSLQHKFIYIAVPKTGSTSIFNAIAPFGASVVPYQKVQYQGYNDTVGFHESAVPEELSHYFTFASVRNPYRRMLSHYLFARQSKGHRLRDVASNCSFYRFLKHTMENGLLLSQCTFLGDARVDYVVRSEEDLTAQLSALPVFNGMKLRVDHHNASNYEIPWRDYYDSRAMGLVASLCRDDFDKYGYSLSLEDANDRS